MTLTRSRPREVYRVYAEDDLDAGGQSGRGEGGEDGLGESLGAEPPGLRRSGRCDEDDRSSTGRERGGRGRGATRAPVIAVLACVCGLIVGLLAVHVLNGGRSLPPPSGGAAAPLRSASGAGAGAGVLGTRPTPRPSVRSRLRRARSDASRRSHDGRPGAPATAGGHDPVAAEAQRVAWPEDSGTGEGREARGSDGAVEQGREIEFGFER